MASKQLESILGRTTTATPAAKATAPASAAPVSAPPTAEIVKMPASEPKPAKQATPKAAPATKPEPEKSIQAYVSASLDKAIRMKAAEEGTTTRTIILRGLKAIGFDVPESELRDKRSKTS